METLPDNLLNFDDISEKGWVIINKIKKPDNIIEVEVKEMLEEKSIDLSSVEPSKPNGLPNKGNTCYINTAIQTIVQIFGDHFISGKYYKKLSDDPDKINFVNDIAHLIAAVENKDGRWSQEHINLHLKNNIKYLSKLDNFKRFGRFQQADSFEFLAELLDLLSEYLRYKIQIEIVSKVDEKDLDSIDKIRLRYCNHIKETLKYTSIIDEQLRGYFRASVTCAHNDCDYISEKFEPFITLSLPIKGMNTLEECLQNYVKPIKLDVENQWFCEKCKRKSQAEKKLSIWNTSEYLIISYKRYVNTMIATVKDNHDITAPFNELDLSLFVEDNKQTENIYDLCAVTVHSGNMNNGHYVIARKMGNSLKNWTVFNDSTVVNVEEQNINNKNAYYLVYKRR